MRGRIAGLIAGAAMVASFPAAAAEPMELWSGAKSGMKVADLAALFPHARKPNYPKALYTDIFTGKPRTRGEEALRDCSLEFEGAPVCASFYFENGALFGVILTAIDPGADVATTSTLALKFKDTISTRYNVTPTCDEYPNNRSFNGPASFCNWKIGELQTSVDYSHGQRSEINRRERPMLTISFIMRARART